MAHAMPTIEDTREVQGCKYKGSCQRRHTGNHVNFIVLFSYKGDPSRDWHCKLAQAMSVVVYGIW